MSLTCPICKAPEVNEKDELNIRAFKVADKHGWWSQCLLPHDLSLDGKDLDGVKIWFVYSEIDNNRLLIEVNGKRYCY